jgi:peptidoglycan/LPS O-acetylase OafA/YrhL
MPEMSRLPEQSMTSASQPENASGPRYRAFGSFRLLLAFIVIWGHAAWIAQGTPVANVVIGARFGSVAVLVFFILSGYIMSEAADTFYAGRPWNFAKNRALKIIPPFLGALVLAVAVHAIANSQGRLFAGISFEGYKSVPPDVFGFWNLIYNAISVLPVISIDYAKWITGSDIYLFVRYIWAVRVEVLFYAVVFLLILWPKTRDFLRQERRLPLLLGFTAFMLFIQFVYNPIWDLQFASYFLFGVLVYFGFSIVGPPLLVGAIVVTLMFSHASQFLTGKLPFAAGWLDQVSDPRRLIAFVLFAMLIAMFLVLRKVRLSSRAAKLDRTLGDLSYSLYLNQYAVLVGFSALSFVPEHPQLTWLAVVIACVVISAIMQRIVERPLVAVRDRVRGQRILEGPRVDAAPLVSHQTGGLLEQRVPPGR